MRKLTLCLVLLILASLLTAELDFRLTRPGNPELYEEINALAEANLANLPKTSRREYSALLREYDDILMSYLIAYESDAKLAEADPADLLSNYHEIVNLIDLQGLNYSEEFFLSYIARQSVSDERITPYRKAMMDGGLSEVAAIQDPLERYREAASWCVEKLKFQQTSGRDLAPTDIIEKSLVGRCEEMQILFVAAARTVGLPSRPASTPWWAHMDNNHAWAEVWLDEGWQYTGDMDAAYFPNQTWFSGMVDKTVMILAQGSLASESDEVLIRGRYESMINSTPNYAGERVRKIRVRTLDEALEPVPEAQIAVLVYNWGALRPLITLATDAEGQLEFSAGSGDFYLSAYHDGRQDLKLVKASEASEIVVDMQLSDQLFGTVDEMLFYPSNEFVRKEAPQEYREDIRQRKEIREDMLKAWQEELESSGIADSLGVAAECRGNLGEYRRFIDRLGEPEPEFMQFLADGDPKFLWQADADLFEAVYLFWQSQDPKSPPQLFAPTVFYEELPVATRTRSGARLYPKNFVQVGKSPRDQLQKVMKRMTKLYKIDNENALSGLLRMDLAARQRYLTKYQYRLLAISMLRANGIPAAFTRLPDNILVWMDGDWHYYDLEKGDFAQSGVEEESSHGVLTLSIVDDDGFDLPMDPARLTLNRLVNGVFYSLNTSFEEQNKGELRAELPEEDLYLHFGYRVSSDQTALQIHPLGAGNKQLKLVARAYPKTWEDASDEILALFDEEILAENELILLGNHDSENSLRILQRVLDLQRDYLFVGHSEQGLGELESYFFSPAWQDFLKEDQMPALQGITLVKTEEGWKAYHGRWESLPQ